MGEFIAMVSHAPYWPMLTEHFLPRILGQDVQVTTATENNEFYLQFNENGPELGSFHSSQGITSGRTNEGITMLIAGKGKDVLVDASIEEFHEWRTKNGVPWQGHEITNKFHPLACGLDQDVHAAKGCYIGQEVLTRMRSRGRTGRKLTTITNGDEVNGTITTEGESASLAIVRC
jgi:folate-binding protein YgfZ